MNAKLARIAALVLCLSGCAPTDTGNPPAALHAGDVSAAVMSGIIEISYSVFGAPGAVDPPEGEVWILDLDDPRPLARAPVASDGSFERLGLGARDGTRVRLWVEAESGRSPPLDRRVTSNGFEPPLRELPACVVFDPPWALDLGEVGAGESVRAALHVANECEGAIMLAPLAVRDPGSGFAVSEAPAEIAAGERAIIEVTIEGSEEGPIVDALDVEMVAPSSARRAVTLIANAR